MIITDESLCVILSSKDFREFHTKHTLNSINQLTDTEGMKKVFERKVDFFTHTGFRTLVFSKKSKENLQNYIVPKDIRFDVLRSLPNRKDVIQIDDHNCIKYIKTDDRLDFITCFRKNKIQGDNVTKDNMVHTHYFTINLITEEIGFDRQNTYTETVFKSLQELIDTYYSKFLVVVTYLELTDVSLKIVEGRLSKNKKKDINIHNSSRYNVIHVNTNWNTMIINVNSFGVRGHWRLQPCGVGRSQFKYTWIKPYEKGLVRRLPQKEVV